MHAPRARHATAPRRSGTIQRMLANNLPSDNIPIRWGLVRGTYEKAPNKADLHVDAKGDGPGLNPKDMCAALTEVYEYMVAREQQGGPLGVLEVHPTGAAIVKVVVEMLGEVFGSFYSKNKARAQKALRKKFGDNGGGSSDKLMPGVLDEHFSSLDALQGTDALEIVPQVSATNVAYKSTLADYDQNMLANTTLGKAKLAKYKGVLRDEDEPMGPGLKITIFSTRIPEIIRLLESRK